MAVLLLLVLAAPGERLEYELRYGPMAVGSLVLEELAPQTLDSVPCLHYRADLSIDMAMAWLFSATYRLESWSRVSDSSTVQSYKRTREPNYRAEWTARYSRSGDTVRYSDGKAYAAVPGSRDLVTVWYWLRGLNLRAGDTVRCSLHADRRNYRLLGAVSRTRRVRVPAGTYDCRVVTPIEKGPLGLVYISDDARRMPVIIRTRFGGLAVSANLRSIENGEE